MEEPKTNQAPEKQDWLLASLVNPETYFSLGLYLFGAVAAGWFLIGIGVLFALLPLFALVFYAAMRKRKRKDVDAADPAMRSDSQ